MIIMKFFRSTLFFILAVAMLPPSFATESLDTGLDLSDEPLPPEQAFSLSTSVVAPDLIRLEWIITPGYYLYKDKFKFSSETTDIGLGKAVLPQGKVKEDEFFGKVETYRDKVGINIPLSRLGDSQTLDLKVVSQGCADIGICYPPQTQTVSLKMMPMPVSNKVAGDDSANESPFSALKRLGNSLGLNDDEEEEFLSADQVFVFSADVENPNAIMARWEIKDGYYLYRDKFAFELEDANGNRIGQIQMPPGKKKHDENFGDMIVYVHGVEIPIQIIRTALQAGDVTLIAKYQGCAERGFCYPPQKQAMPLSLPKATAQTVALTTISDSNNNSNSFLATSSSEPVSEQDQIANTLASGSVILTILSFFGFGLLLALTPCVFPMIPILSSIIVGQGDSITTRKAFLMSLVYVLAMAVTYTVAGVFAGLSGENLQALFQTPWILYSFAGVFVLLSFSMFGFYELQMPSSIQSKLTQISNNQQGGTLIGVAIMGFLSALIVGPCVAAPLAGALIYIGQTGDPWLGGTALFALSMGMGAPLLAIGVSAGKFLPKAGTWMDTVKAVFGVLMLAVAIWMLERVVSSEVTMLLWATLLIVSAIYMGVLEQIKETAAGWSRLWKGLGAVAIIYGAIIIIGFANGGKDVFQPLAGFSGGGGTVAHQELVFKRFKGNEQLDQAVRSAQQAGKITMVDFYADWCISCKEMEKYTFSNPEVQALLKDVVLLQADVTLNDAEDKALLKRFGLQGPPSILFFDKSGKERRGHRLVGFLSAEKFSAHVREVKGET
ncbi:MAG: protein-disulfide reductase DsbD [Thiohalomonadales bacterium]